MNIVRTDYYYYYPEVVHLKYVVDENCAGNKDLIKEARLSFVSGHWFLQSDFSNYFNEKTYFIVAFWISITRLNDHMHHPEDVIMGSIIGIICAFLMHREEEESSTDKETEIPSSPSIAPAGGKTVMTPMNLEFHHTF